MFITGFVTRIKCAFRDKGNDFLDPFISRDAGDPVLFLLFQPGFGGRLSPVKTAVVADQDYRQAA